MKHELKIELERVVKAAQREALTDAFNMLMDKANKIDKVLFNPTGESIKGYTFGPKYDKMAEKWHSLLHKSMTYTNAAAALINLKESYY